MSAKLSKENWAMARVYSFLDGNPKHDNDLRGGGQGQSTPSAPSRPPAAPSVIKHIKDGFKSVLDDPEYVNIRGERAKAQYWRFKTQPFYDYGIERGMRVKEIDALVDIAKRELDPSTLEGNGILEDICQSIENCLVPRGTTVDNRSFNNLVAERDMMRRNARNWRNISNRSSPSSSPRVAPESPGAVTGRSKEGYGYDLRRHLEGAGLWEYVSSALTLPSKVVNEIVNPDSVARQGVKKVVNEVVNPDSVVRKRISDVSKGIRKDYPPSARRTLAQYGDWTVIDVMLRRDPVQTAINAAFNVITLGAWDKAKEAESMDKLFHLGMVLTVSNGNKEQKILVEKNEVINIGMPKKVEADSTFLEVPTPNPPVSLKTFLEKGEARRPGGDFFKYDPFANNCQDFIAVLLVGNNIYTDKARQFVKQDVTSLVSRLPKYTHAFAKGITDLGGIANVALEGGKSSEASTPAYPFKTQLEAAGLEPSSYLAEARRRAKNHHYPHKLLGFAKDGKHKLVIPDKDGRLVSFGKVGYGDNIIYSHLEKNGEVPKGTADAKKNTFQKSHTKIKGDWASKPFSPNNLALKVLW
jgi:hypothetical protein